MRAFRAFRYAPMLLLAALPGCVLTSAQILAEFDLANPIHVVDANTLAALQIDLSENADYRDHKSDLADLTDIALLGRVTNLGNGDPIRAEVWVTRDLTNLTLETQVRAQGQLLWGPFIVPGLETRTINWNESAGLITGPGRDLLIQEAKGDGNCTLYVIDSSGLFHFDWTDGALVLVLDVGI